MNVAERVTLVEVLERTRSFEEFAAAGEALVRRLEAEGIAALVTVQLYADPGSSEAGAILSFADAGQLMRHVEIVTGWEEFHRYVETVRPVDVRVYGRLSPEAAEWLRGFGVSAKTFARHVAGFVR